MMGKDNNCFKVQRVTRAETRALKALSKGEADPYEQRIALRCIVDKFSRSHDVLYVPGSFDQSSFMTGRGFVGQQILKRLKLPVGKLHPEAEEE